MGRNSSFFHAYAVGAWLEPLEQNGKEGYFTLNVGYMTLDPEENRPPGQLEYVIMFNNPLSTIDDMQIKGVIPLGGLNHVNEHELEYTLSDEPNLDIVIYYCASPDQWGPLVQTAWTGEDMLGQECGVSMVGGRKTMKKHYGINLQTDGKMRVF